MILCTTTFGEGEAAVLTSEQAQALLDSAWWAGKNHMLPRSSINHVSNDDGSGWRIFRIPLDWIRANEAGDRYDATVDLNRAKDYQASPIKAPVHLVFGRRLLQSGGTCANVHDGGHRVTAARLNGDTAIWAVIQESQLALLKQTRAEPKRQPQWGAREISGVLRQVESTTEPVVQGNPADLHHVP